MAKELFSLETWAEIVTVESDGKPKKMMRIETCIEEEDTMVYSYVELDHIEKALLEHIEKALIKEG